MGKQPTLGQKKTKESIAKAASQRSKQTKKKWTKGRVKDKQNNAVFLDKAAYDTINQQLPKIGKLVTVSVLIDKFKIGGALARRVIRHYAEKGILVRVGDPHHAQYIYTVSESALAAQKKDVVAAPAAGQKGKQSKKGKETKE